MKRTTRAALVLTGALTAALLAGCSSAPKKAASGDEMGSGMVWGYVAASERVQLQAINIQPQSDQLVLDVVTVPTEAWIVVVNVDKEGVRGSQVGLKHLKPGEWTGIAVPVKGMPGQEVAVSLYADKGARGTFDFDPARKKESPDRPYFVDGQEVTITVRLQ